MIKAFSELRCDVLCLSEMGEVQVGLESAFARAEIISSGVAQPAPGSLRRWFEGALQEVQAGDWGIYPRGHYVTLVRPDAGIEVDKEEEVNIYPAQDFRVAQVLRCCGPGAALLHEDGASGGMRRSTARAAILCPLVVHECALSGVQEAALHTGSATGRAG